MNVRRHVASIVFFSLSALAGDGDAAQCNDSIDNNGNALIDMTDWYCKTPLDDDEFSFLSGVPGDDLNQPHALDCWFDLNSGSGDDGCSIHACCDIDGSCPADLEPELFNANQCSASQQCSDNCLPQTKEGCDCFGCCEICLPGSGCANVFVNPAVSPTCTIEVLGDPSKCRTCTPNPSCRIPSHIFIDGFEIQPSQFKLLGSVPSLGSLGN